MRSIPKYCITLLVFLVIFFSTEIISKPVTQKELITVSNRFIQTRLNTNQVFLTNQISLKKNSVDGITTDSESKDLGYVVSLAPTGFLILSSDTDMEPVIAYSYRNNWSADTSKANHFYQWLVSDLKARMESLDQLPEKIRLKNNEKWQTYLSSDQNQHVSQVVEQWPPAGSTTTGGWVETTWIQGAPFNNFCPLDPTDYQRCLTGCGATAIAQIVNYHQYFGNKRFSADDRYSNTSPDISIDGDSTLLDFPSFKQLNRYLDTLQFKFDQNLPLDTNNMAALNFAAGLIADTKYDKSGSAVYNDQVYQAFINEMDYATASLTSPDEMFYDRLKDNMKEGLPAQLSIIGSTAGHALICDGYNTDDFYHLNFGWGDSRPAAITDAWYHMPEGIPYGDVLIYNAVIDIRPGLDSQTNLVLSDTLFKFKPVIIDNLSEAISCKFLNDGLKTLYIDEIILPDYFFAKIGAGQLTQHIDQLALEPGEELVLDLFCKPDSLGKFSGEMEIILSLDNRKRFKYLPLIGFGRGETGTIVTENQVSGVWDKTGSPYYIVDNLAIAPGRQLLIKAGTQIFSEHGCSFEIGPDAQLIAQGVAGDSVYFSATRPDKGWQGLTFYSSGEDDILSYCAISDVQSNSAIQLENTNAMITHSILKNNQSLDGGTINAMNSDFRLSHSTIIAEFGDFRWGYLSERICAYSRKFEIYSQPGYRWRGNLYQRFISCF